MTMETGRIYRLLCPLSLLHHLVSVHQHSLALLLLLLHYLHHDLRPLHPHPIENHFSRLCSSYNSRLRFSLSASVVCLSSSSMVLQQYIRIHISSTRLLLAHSHFSNSHNMSSILTPHSLPLHHFQQHQ